ncbi:iron chelate uptake ABC transporter family permease subunit [Gephyromycinifex aptenodytis]|uniref:iron chelate uptake ABC transporter family permease subunit n=1 Tax=Gephyromycinifex aptenodytis TaxID=2716227 RepID=UPI001447DFE3|nr:iron chelate uptake ABC transporter family permease subunit [Gephyromycinifex aptenodytis]
MSTVTTEPAVHARTVSPGRRLTFVLIVAALSILAFLALDSGGDLAFTLEYRGRKLLGMILVGIGTGAATVAFQTVTSNRILTPSVMGLDALYAFLQTLLVFLLGATLSSHLGPIAMFATNLAVMMLFGLGLAAMLAATRTSVHMLVLIGIVLGTLLRSLQSLLTRMMDPTSFLMLQGNLFASFNTVHPELLGISSVLVALGCAWLWWRRHELDVMALGPQSAQGLGVDPHQIIREVLLVAIMLVSVCTALVGPITFLGLIVANVAYIVSTSGKHAWTLPMACALAVVMLVGGQAILEHVFGQAVLLSVIIEFGGGLLFIWLVMSGSALKGKQS